MKGGLLGAAGSPIPRKGAKEVAMQTGRNGEIEDVHAERKKCKDRQTDKRGKRAQMSGLLYR